MGKLLSDEITKNCKINEDVTHEVLDNDLKLEDGRIIPKKIPVHVNIWEMHRNDKLWPNSDLYDPGRFYENRYNTDPYAYLPFSAGARNCIGRHFANQEMKTTLAHIFQKFEIVEATKQTTPIIQIVYRPENGAFVRLRIKE